MFGDRLAMKLQQSNPRERVRVNAVNSRLLNTAGDIRLMVDPPHAQHIMVRDLEGVRLLEGGSGEIDKKADPDLSHWMDGVGYYIAKEFSITNNKVVVGHRPDLRDNPRGRSARPPLCWRRRGAAS